MSNTVWLVLSFIAGVVSVGVAYSYFRWVVKQDPGTERAQRVAGWIRDGARSYLKKLYSALGLLAGGLAIIIAIVFGLQINFGYGLTMAITFIFGSLCSTAAGYMGMTVAVEANVRSATAASKGLNPAFNLAFKAGAVMGLAMVGLALMGMSLVFLITGDANLVLGFSFGASTLALLAKAGGGIYTKTADIAADLVGKVEVGIPEDDPRNPAVVADNVGDNVGDVAGMGADIFDSYVASSVAAMLLGAALLKLSPETRVLYTIFPLILCMLGAIAALIGVQFVQVKEGGKPGTSLNNGTIYTCIIFGVLVIAVVLVMGLDKAVMWATLAGLIVGVIIGFTSDFFTGDDRPPVVETARVSTSGAAINIITGFSYGLISIAPSVVGIAAATLIAYFIADQSAVVNGVYGVGIAAVGMLAISGMIVSSDAYGPIVDNARGIAEMAGMPEDVIEVADVMDAAGNTAKAITKGFAISAAALTVLALFAAYSSEISIAVAEHGLPAIDMTMSLANPMVIAAILLGALTPPLFSALTMLSVTHNAFDMIEEIRRQFHADPGILAGTVEPDYVKCVSLASQNALQSLILPACLAVVLPLVVGFIMGPEALGAFLGGAIITGILFALLMANAGGTWDNAKKYIESGNFGGKGSEAHKAGVVGDTVGDPFKDTAGPSLNTLITVMSLVSSLFAPVIAAFHLFGG
ncbi:MAG TPA: sodium-translocating pyrophosphatase [Anaerolineae bacterium]|nr:sodium-translocating pyrophosphatase [Anaerolineae bacterium]HQI86450.1 sodium-translocating pyrophosphatase [Anaerolineae bacterium]